MALSNWDTFAVDQDGNPSPGQFTHGKIAVEVYKDHLTVYKDRERIVGAIHSGHVEIEGVTILAVRGPQRGIYTAVFAEFAKPFKAVAAIGCEGYHQVVGSRTDSAGQWVDFVEWNYVGVEPQSVTYLKGLLQMWAGEHWIEELAKIDLSRGTRYNQGDGYFAAHLDLGNPSTAPGEAGEPILH